MSTESSHPPTALRGRTTMTGDHVPVLAREVCRALAPILGSDGRPDGPGASGGSDRPSGREPIFVDATAGLAGHLCLLLAAAPHARALAFDRDGEAQEIARQRVAQAGFSERVTWISAPFSEIRERVAAEGVAEVTAILADLGVSSLQLDRGERGFSWRSDAPLDMRMDRTRGMAASDVLATIDVEALTRILRDLGEEPDARRIAQAIVAARPTTTLGLADVVTAAMSAPARRKLGVRIHPATRTFQALRLHVNDELGEIDRLLADAPALLAPGGRLAVISFHSLEDRRVKQRFAGLSRPPPLPPGLPLRSDEVPRPKFALPVDFAKGVVPADDEVSANPRARSARLRVLERPTE